MTTVVTLVQKFFFGVSLVRTPLLLLSAILLTLGVLAILLGIMAEIIVRTYYESQQLPPYRIKTIFKGNRESVIPLVHEASHSGKKI
jgi:hypothetical protein